MRKKIADIRKGFNNKTVLKNFLSIFWTNIFAKVSGFVILVYIARIFDVETFGAMSFSRAVVDYFAIFIMLGLNDYAVIKAPSDREARKMGEYVGNLLGLRLVISIMAFAALTMAALFVPRLTSHSSLLLIFGLTLFTRAINIEWLFIAIERMDFIAFSRTFSQLFYLLFTVVFIKYPEDILWYAAIIFLTDLLVSVLLFVYYRRQVGRFSFSFNYHEWLRVMKYTLPLAGSQMLGLIRLNADIVLLGFLATPREVGLYSVGTRLLNQGIDGVSMIRKTIFPQIVKSYKEEARKKLLDINLMCGKYGIILGVLFGGVGTFFAEQIITTIFGPNFIGAALPFQIMSWVVSLHLIGLAIPHTVMVHSRRLYFIADLLAAISNLALNLLLIPRLGIKGAAIAYVFSTLVWLLMLYYSFCREIFVINLSKYLAKPVIACGIAVAVAQLLGNMPLLPGLVFFMTVYGGLLILSKAISLSEIRSYL